MMCESADCSQKRSWVDVLMNDSQSSKGCGREEDWVKMNSSSNTIYLLPADSFEMNKGSTSSSTSGWNEHKLDDFEGVADEFFLGGMEDIDMVNGAQVSRGCGRVDDWVRIHNSCNPKYLLPSDPFEMDRATEIDIGRRISEKIESWIGRCTNDCTVRGGYPVAGSSYQRREPFLSLFETSVNYADDFNNVGLSGSDIDVTGSGNVGAFGAVEEASFSYIEESILHLIEDESLRALVNIEDRALVSGSSFPGSVFDVAGNRSFESCEDVEEILYTGRRDAKLSDGDVNCIFEGIISSLKYLGVQDLLSVEKVCRSLRSATGVSESSGFVSQL